jgi:2-haloacid dehalogenase
VTALWRDKQLQYTWLRGLQGDHADFWQVTGDALDFTLETLGISDPGVRGCFPEVPDLLATLKGAGFATAFLLNGAPGMLADAVAGAKLDGLSIMPSRSRRSAYSNRIPACISAPSTV